MISKKNLLYIFATVIVLIILAVFLIRERVGDIRLSVLPPAGDLTKTTRETQQVGVGETVAFPLKLLENFQIGTFAKNLGNARDLEFTQDGTLFVSIPAQGKILALPDKNYDGIADEVKEILQGLNKPHGIAFYNGKLFVAEETKIARYNWDPEKLSVTFDKLLFSLPEGGRHFTRTIAFNKKGQMFVSIGSTCNVCFEKNEWLSAVVVSDTEGINPTLFAKGLRNSVFITTNPATDEVWGTEMGRDFLGDNLPPDEINIISEGKDYGWPRCFGNKVHDTNFDSSGSGQSCENTESPFYEIPAHSAPLGLVFINSPQFPKEWQGDLLVSYHGSWNRSVPTGYKITRLNVEGNTIKSEQDFVSGFLQGPQTYGRPVDLIFDSQGSLYISDDKSESIYKVTGG
ncbi:hypothetical protein A2Z23_03455 [Candidatus Curtissbacteria bacterium RBG_16_39_7]|uniref:Pyrroloquinoline quinone-dependent pyranose dehydrogenase beta-propeller domain-containing protein n=1 Tax=Candidatus Curtissbacteria bacterium RBG_16_39_7 TaxID=1797707 RepID=A0A1F5G3S0_9BACT|nr:MAG: hypothetical protein A2Z23_03455 [Candidatus Curtissbacteria bacterium RBG_16_39_7]